MTGTRNALRLWDRLARYKGQNSRVHQLKEAFKDAAFNQKWPPARFRTVDSVYSISSLAIACLTGASITFGYASNAGKAVGMISALENRCRCSSRTTPTRNHPTSRGGSAEPSDPYGSGV